ncbi:MAG: EamA family transporter [Spirochaetota bacterium]
MIGITVAFIAQVFIGGSLIIDKIILGEQGKIKVVPYVFWIAIMNCFGLLFFLFGFIPPAAAATYGIVFLAALSFIIMLLCYYQVLSRGEASEAVPVVGGFAPLATFLIGELFLASRLSFTEAIGFVLLITGGFLLFFSERAKLKELLPWTLLAAFFTGTTNILEKMVFDNTGNFVTGYALMKTATLLIGLSMLAFPSLRRHILSTSKKTPNPHKVLYFINRGMAGLGSFLIFYAIKLEAHPAIVESINGVRYVLVFILAFILAKCAPKILNETMKGWRMGLKLTATIAIVLGLAVLGVGKHYLSQPVPKASEVIWGVTFSEHMTEKLGIDTDETLRAIVRDLKPDGLRLVAYWDRIEKVKGTYDFSSLDRQMKIARDGKVKVILVIGERVPRWPECHIPGWAVPQEDLMRYVRVVIERYRGYENILYWQVENEPFLHFGKCPDVDTHLIAQEIQAVKALDPGRKVLMTDGGEFGDWYRAAYRSDLFGTTLYRKVHNRFFGEVTYPITPEVYPLKRDFVRFLTGRKDQPFVVIELGTEPWASKQIYEMTPQEQMANFSIADFKDNTRYALECRFDTYYLWGAEWWYYLKKVHGIDAYWNFAADLFAGKTDL